MPARMPWEENMDRRSFVIGTAASAFAAAPAFAQEAFPSHVITIINAFPPGGINDLVTRPLAATMEPILKTAGGGRDQSPALPDRSARRSRLARSRTATRCCRITPAFPVTPKWTSCSDGR